jgi:predicted nucleic acid-binding protein
MKVYLDSNFFIYLFARKSEFHTWCVELAESIENGEIDAISSVTTLTEVLSHKDSHAIETALQRINNLKFIDLDKATSLKAAELRRRHSSLTTPDAQHLACALTSKAATMVTNDRYLAKVAAEYLKIKQLKINPAQA